MIETNGFMSVAEAARLLHRSQEQVRRNLRDGKLKGQRIGNQWFVDDRLIGEEGADKRGPLIPHDLIEEINRNRDALYERTGQVYDVVQWVHESREDH